jgi:ubiquinone biosynthesis protein COQ4
MSAAIPTAVTKADTTAAAAAPSAIAPPPPRRRVQWRRASRALGRLIDDPERTEQVFELIEALAGNSGERLFQRFLRQPNGPRLLREKPALLATLRDLPALESLPEGSFGRAYAAFMREGELRAEGLLEASEQAEREGREQPIDPERDWFYARLRDMHDLWHVLTGYGRDVAGEAANLAFTHAQTRNRGVGVIVLAAVVLGPKTLDLGWPRYLWRAWRRGQRAALLCAARYEELLPLPLDEARRRLSVSPPAQAHPEGILVAHRDELVAVAR